MNVKDSNFYDFFNLMSFMQIGFRYYSVKNRDTPPIHTCIEDSGDFEVKQARDIE